MCPKYFFGQSFSQFILVQCYPGGKKRSLFVVLNSSEIAPSMLPLVAVILKKLRLLRGKNLCNWDFFLVICQTDF